MPSAARQGLDALPGAEREACEADREVVALAGILEDLVAAVDVIEVVAGAALEIVVARAADQEVVAAEADEEVVAAAAVQIVDPLAAVEALAEFVAGQVDRDTLSWLSATSVSISLPSRSV